MAINEPNLTLPTVVTTPETVVAKLPQKASVQSGTPEAGPSSENGAAGGAEQNLKKTVAKILAVPETAKVKVAKVEVAVAVEVRIEQ